MSAARQVADWIAKSPTAVHAVETAAHELQIAGFEEVSIQSNFPKASGPYFVKQAGSLFAWIQKADITGFRILGTHSDSPGFRIRPNPERKTPAGTSLGVEIYGSPLWNSWLDRDLGIAGRVLVEGAEGLEKRLVNIAQPVCKIPQLAVHLDRQVNKNGVKLDPKTDLSPIYLAETPLRELVASAVETSPHSIISWDLQIYDLQPSTIFGSESQGYLSSARIDNLVSTFAGLAAMIQAAEPPEGQLPVLCVFDHEEVGSGSVTGAESSLIGRILNRIAEANGASLESVADSSIAISADCAHASHPSHLDAHEPNHLIAMNKGVALKENANQRYATSLDSEATFFGLIGTDFVLQRYSQPNHIPCGSTIGPILSASLGIPTVDIGVPQLAMHSVRETCGTGDIESLVELVGRFWASIL